MQWNRRSLWPRLVRSLLVAAPIVAGVAIFIWMVRHRQAPARTPIAEAARPLRVIEAPLAALRPRAIGYGTARPADIWSAVAEVKGQVIATHPELNPGAVLKAGEVALRIDPTEVELLIAQQEAEIAQAEAQLAELDAQEKNLEASLEIERASLELAEADLARLRSLRGSNSVSEAEYERKAREVLLQQQTTQSLINSVNVLPAQRRSLQATLEARRAALERARLDLERTVVEVPFDCRLSDVQIEQGQFLAAGQQLFDAYGIDEVEVEAQFPISQVRPLLPPATEPVDLTDDVMKTMRQIFDVEATVRLETGDLDVSWNARFDRIREQLDVQTQTVRIVVAVDNPFAKAIPGVRPPLTPGMFCEVELRAPPRTGQIVIPRRALHDGSVYLVDQQNRLRRRAVEVESVQGRLAVIKAGLDGGERLVVSDPTPAVEGMLVEPTIDDATATALIAEAEGSGRLP